jgi:hypothetical protein
MSILQTAAGKIYIEKVVIVLYELSQLSGSTIRFIVK